MLQFSGALVPKGHLFDSYQVQIARKYGVAYQEPVSDPAIPIFSPYLQFLLSQAGNACTSPITACQIHGVSKLST